jgi:hypothetical protein
LRGLKPVVEVGIAISVTGEALARRFFADFALFGRRDDGEQAAR